MSTMMSLKRTAGIPAILRAQPQIHVEIDLTLLITTDQV